MKNKIFYGGKPAFTEGDKDSFTRGKYECKAVMTDRKGNPVAISQSKDSDFPIWKVEYGCSCVVFATYDEAMAFCKGRFTK